MIWLSYVFIFVVLTSTAVRMWLTQRQVKAVRAHRNAVPQPFAASIELADHQKAADYTLARATLTQIDTIYGAIILLAMTIGGVINWIDQYSHKFGLSDQWRGIAVIGIVMLVMMIADLPLSWVRTFRVEAKFGFNRMTQTMFVLDLLKGISLAIVIGVPLLWLILKITRVAGKAWWFDAWLVWITFTLLITWAWPIFIAPLFNKFTLLKDESLTQRISDLLARCKFKSAGVFVMDGSARSTHGNAYFTGFGRNKRIVFFDTLLERLTPGEIEAVLAHELGHYSLHHIRKQLIVSIVTGFIAFLVLGLLADWADFYSALGVDTPSTHAALLLFMLASGPFLYFFTPISAAWSRKHEFEADTFASRHSNANELISGLVKLYRDNASTLTPDPVHSKFYDSHPPALERITFLQSLPVANAPA
jgi:STE24 endopeptidase